MPAFHRLLVALLIGFSLTACKKSIGSGSNMQPVIVQKSDFLYISGSSIMDSSGNTINLQGVAFGNDVWNNDVEIPTTHHNEQDFLRVKNMHMNVIRFYMNYRSFESDAAPYTYKQTGWDWLDENIAWAKKYGIYLILNMHVPQGGYQSQGTGDALWTDVENENRLAALWTAIAKRYKNEPSLAGFGLVNEPVPVASLTQWQQLAQRLTNAIKQEDTNHIIFVEKPIYIKQVQGEDANLNFPVIDGKNIAYEFHIYDPIQYTHQLFTWANQGEGGKYPDDNILSYTNGSWYTAAFNEPQLPEGSSGWAYYEGEKYTIADDKIKLGLPALVAQNAGGTAYFDDISIKEYDPQGNFTNTLYSINPTGLDGWSYWSANNSGTGNFSSQTGYGDAGSLYITGATADCNLSNYSKLFIPKQGYSYQVCGYMKGDAIATGAACMLRLDFITTPDPVYGRNKDYLQAVLKKYTDWGKLKNVPLYMGEFGAGIHCFANGKGGLDWVSDMVDIAKASNLNFTYHDYHEDAFGLYYGYGTLPNPANANQPLINLLTQKLP